MTAKEKLIILQYMMDEITASYAKMKKRNHSHQDLIHLEVVKKEIRQTIDQLMKSMPDCYPIVVQEDCMIENGEEREVQTNMTGYPEDISSHISYIGFIPSMGYLKPICQFEPEMGMRFYMKNIISDGIYEDNNDCCDETIIQYISPGIYQINCGFTVGIAFVEEMKQEFSPTKNYHKVG